ncbi:MAG TPA: hypothetical protein VGC61_08335 [Pyrinomonadaceae bacterium]|jgi:hypothetical protein
MTSRNRTSFKGASAFVLLALLAMTMGAQTADGDWTSYNRTYSGERFSPLKEISTANVPQLRRVCPDRGLRCRNR